MDSVQKARSLRTRLTDPERKLWYHLRDRRFLGMKFRRQHPLGRYVVDFVCIECRLVVELDGGQHLERGDYDQERNRWLESRGFRVLRFWNHEVTQEFEAVLERIRAVALTPGPSPA